MPVWMRSQTAHSGSLTAFAQHDALSHQPERERQQVVWTTTVSGSSGSGAALGSGAAMPASRHPATSTGAVQTEAMKQILGVIYKKLWNLEKKKGKLDDYQERMNKGERLNQDELDAFSEYQEVTNNLQFAKELHSSFMALSQDIQRTIKKTAPWEQLMRE
ncbi:Caprin-1 [Saguinus oedipus]|uniref:Caprin-1 n=1 Tax=Saguinus oedipus TaxID=9490 RepID=A0ABQ9UG48_SAGOE|nr:Caprin-1 [Saguinus oedipus]